MPPTPYRLVFLRNAVLDSVEMKCPKPCRAGTSCSYVGEDGSPCYGVHPGEQGVVRKVVPSHSFTSPRDGKQIFMPARVKLFAEDSDPRSARFAPYYTRIKMGLSWPDWCEREGLEMPRGEGPAWQDPKCVRLSYIVGFVSDEKELLYETQEERLDALEDRLRGESAELRSRFYSETKRSPVAAEPAAEEELVAEFSEEEVRLAPYAQAAEFSLTMAAIQASNARQEEARRAAIFAAQQEQLRQQQQYLAWQQQQYLAWQQQQYAAWYAAQQRAGGPRPEPQQQRAAAAAQPPEDPRVAEIRRKNYLGEQIYPLVKQIMEATEEDRAADGMAGPFFTAGKITGMLLEGCSVAELEELLVDDSKFSPLLMEACEVLREAQAAEVAKAAGGGGVKHKVEIRPAAAVPKPAVPGNEAMAACADDTVRQLMEDVRRIDAGLPLRELPPSITSYEAQPDGSVRVEKTVYPAEPKNSLRRQAIARSAGRR